MSSGGVSNQICDYNVVSVISTGSFGTCYTVKHKRCGKMYVWKAVDYGSMSDTQKRLLISEINFLSTIKHPYILRYYNIINHVETTTLFVVMELCQQGDLEQLITSCKKHGVPLNEAFVWKVLYQIAKALQTLHFKLYDVNTHYAHIKPSNIYLDENFNVKFNYFSLARIFQNKESTRIRKSTNSKLIHILSLGCLVQEMCIYSGLDSQQSSVHSGNSSRIKRSSRLPTLYSETLRDITQLLLNIDSESQPSIEMVLYHPHVVENYCSSAVPIDNLEVFWSNKQYNLESLKGVEHVNLETFGHEETLKSNEKHKVTTRTGRYLNDVNYFNNFRIEGKEALDNDLNNYAEICGNKSSKSKQEVPVGERHLKNKFRTKIKQLKIKEASLQAKEYIIKQKEEMIEKREHQLLALETQAKKRVPLADINGGSSGQKEKLTKRNNNRLHLVTTGYCPKIMGKYKDDLDTTTCSADPGDSSLMATTAKLNPQKILRPSYFASQNSFRKMDKHISFNSIAKMHELPSLTTTSWSIYRRNYKIDTAETISKEVKFTQL